jgi:hypothetical protein
MCLYGRQHVNHEVGHGYIANNKKFAYLNIPKNGSTNIKKVFGGEYCDLSKLRLFPECVLLIVLRDPVERFFSGCYEYLQRNYNGPLDAHLYPLLYDAKVFDEHTEHQHYFLDTTDTTNARYFYLDNKFSKRFKKSTGLRVMQNHNNDWQKIPYGVPDREFKQGLVDYVKNNYGFAHLLNFYKKDAEIIQSRLDIDLFSVYK